MTKYAILLGFGLFEESNQKYKAYLDRFVKFVKKNKIDVVVLCGGHTNLKSPEKSEAGTMADYLTKFLDSNVKIVLEDRSLTTEQNIKFAKEHMNLDPKNKIFIVSDSVRFFKIYWLMLYHWFGLSKDEINAEWLKIAKEAYNNPKKKAINIELKDMKRLLAYKNVRITIDGLHKDYKNAVQVILSEVFEIEGLYDQNVNNRYLEQTKAKEEARAKFGLK
jgi:dihydrodipicolinate synthase/N-acetylneuraminate lyase